MIQNVREMDNFDGVRNKPLKVDDINPFDIPSNFIEKE